MGQLEGKIAWVTGAGTGIGAATAERFAAEGATVVITGRRKEPLEEVAGRIKAAGGKAVVRPADLMKATQVQAVVDGIAKEFGRIDVLVSNAGLNIVDRGWANISPAGIDELIGGNLTSAFYVAQATLPVMRAQGGGVMIHTASMAGRNIGLMSGPGYVASKHGVVAMSHTINQAECINGIRSTAFCPGEVNTEILKKRPNPLTQQELDEMLQPQDCADMLLYIATLPPHVTMNEVWLTPTKNRGYVRALNVKL